MNVEDNNAKSIPDVNTYEVLVTWNSWQKSRCSTESARILNE